MTAWKNTERRVMSILGGRRIPITGRQRGDVPDGDHPLYSPEIKHRKSLPQWLHDAMAQAVASVRDDKIPIVVLHELGKHTDYVIIRLEDMKRLSEDQT